MYKWAILTYIGFVCLLFIQYLIYTYEDYCLIIIGYLIYTYEETCERLSGKIYNHYDSLLYNLLYNLFNIEKDIIILFIGFGCILLIKILGYVFLISTDKNNMPIKKQRMFVILNVLIVLYIVVIRMIFRDTKINNLTNLFFFEYVGPIFCTIYVGIVFLFFMLSIYELGKINHQISEPDRKININILISNIFKEINKDKLFVSKEFKDLLKDYINNTSKELTIRDKIEIILPYLKKIKAYKHIDHLNSNNLNIINDMG